MSISVSSLRAQAGRFEFELTFPDPVHEFDAGDGDRGVSEPLQTEHGPKRSLIGR